MNLWMSGRLRPVPLIPAKAMSVVVLLGIATTSIFRHDWYKLRFCSGTLVLVPSNLAEKAYLDRPN